MWASTPTIRPRAFCNLCRGRRLRPTEVPLGDDAPFQRAVPQGDFLALRAHSVDKRQPLQVLGRAACGVVGRPAYRPPSTYGSASVDGGSMWASTPTIGQGVRWFSVSIPPSSPSANPPPFTQGRLGCGITRGAFVSSPLSQLR